MGKARIGPAGGRVTQELGPVLLTVQGVCDELADIVEGGNLYVSDEE